ncbi:iron uptake porin [Candidatus Synechococcus calcipolaris G9]|uniref:Iron uptake porin n=1 Tax=Candidatus Synechococcus calcipolaris G9 TaxID=1497997 RepID=A0ABT6F0K9_9SYNE|nr:iron uptake porin [Candidatus Synechococcus calcipolaris]MDG2991380.1 iron uptake porin [Candidatus Synechococcus calcipolaris G9]
MSRVLWKLLLASPVLVTGLGVMNGAAIAAESSQELLNIDVAELQPTPGSESLLTLPTQSTEFIAQNRRNNQAPTPSVAELEGGPVVNPAPAQPHRQDQGLGVRRQMPQVTSVNQLSDVRPTDWAYQALASLVEKYGCIAGYPDGTFRGNRAATRYELAAALNACLDVISDRFATKEDLAALRKLMEEFAVELALVQGRVTNLEGRVSNLEATQFATITKLSGSVIFNVSGVFPGSGIADPTVNVGGSNANINNNPVFSHRTRLILDTSFYGRDQLRIRLQSGNIQGYNAVTGTNMGRLAYEANTGNGFVLNKLYYRFPITKDGRGRLIVDAQGGDFTDNVQTFNPLLSSGDNGALSRFGRYNPIFRNPGAGAGVTFRYTLLDNKDRGTGLDFNLGYLAPGANSPNTVTNTGGGFTAFNSGLFGGAYAALAQVDVRPVRNLAFGLTYIRSFGTDVTGGTGSSWTGAAYPNSGYGPIVASNAGLSNNPTGGTNGVANNSADSFGFQFSYRVMPKFGVSGWAGYSNVTAQQGPFNGRNAQIMNWALTAAAPDLWNRGDVLGLIFGQPPQMISSPVNGGPRSTFDSYHIEGFYRFRFTPNIAVTPGIITIINPNSNTSNSPLVLGVVRTTFTF